AKSRTVVVRLVSTAGTGYFYVATRRRVVDKLQFMKYDPIVKRHCLFTEQKK
ncbi:hypothetical protein EDD86DRAFT_190294, partial [Gorgonomyces haynaldii]